MMDNKASTAVKEFLQKEKNGYQLVPPHIHRRNEAERAIHSFKAHFITKLSTVDYHFPTIMHLWCCLIHQATITLNLLRNSRLNKKLPACAQVFRPFNYSTTPLAPPGTRIVAHEKPKQRATWAAHGVIGWYIGPAMEHHRCYKVYVTDTGSERISDTVEFPPTKCSTPALTQTDYIIIAATNLTKILQSPPSLSPFHDVSTDTMASIIKLAALFYRMSTPPAITTPAIPTRVLTQNVEPPRVLTTSEPTITPPRVPTTPAPTRVNTGNTPPRQQTITMISQE
jgi:hypothetical protein